MNSASREDALQPVQRVRRAILVVDVVESVRLMREHEADVIDRWRRFVNTVRTRVLPPHGGRLVKSLGDGMLLEFESVAPALAASFEIRRRIDEVNAGRPTEAALLLRCGLHMAEVVVEDFDILGAGVNLAARLAALGRPGDLIASTEVRDAIAPGLDAEVEDLGPCWLKHFDAPVHAYRLEAPGAPAAMAAPRPAEEPGMLPTIAVIPLHCRGGSSLDTAIGELVADGVIAQLSMTSALHVVSRLSTSVLRDRTAPLAALAQAVGATFILSGSYVAHEGRVTMTLELADARDGTVAWATRRDCAVAELLAAECPALDAIADGVQAAVVQCEARRTLRQPLPNLASFSLLLGSVGLLHRAAPQDFGRAREALTELAERVPRHGASYAWLAKWHCLRIIRGLTASPEADRVEAQWRIEQALERDDTSAVAWSMRGLVHGFLGKDLAAAEAAYGTALGHNPSEPLAWLYMATLRSWQGRGPEAAAAAERALRLSPLDPMRYYFESLAAAGFLADGQYARAAALCRHSLKLNRGHTPTHRVLAISEMLGGRAEAARAVVDELRALEPQLTVSKYLDRYPGGPAPHARRYAEALQEAGLPH